MASQMVTTTSTSVHTTAGDAGLRERKEKESEIGSSDNGFLRPKLKRTESDSSALSRWVPPACASADGRN